MNRWLIVICLLGAGACTWQPAPASSGAAAAKVRVRSAWGGLSLDSPLITELVFLRSGDGFSVSGTHSRAGKMTAMASMDVSAAKVEALVMAMRAASESTFAPADLGRKPDEIQAQIDEALEPDDELNNAPAIAEKLRMYRESLRLPEVLATTLTNGFRSFHTDDYPSVLIEITLTDGSRLSASSRSQQYLMLPWARKGMQPSYARGIPDALWNLLPEGATNRERLHGRATDHELDELVGAALHDPLNRLTAEATAGPALAVLARNFIVENVKAQRRFAGMKLGPALFATLRLPDGPPNLAMLVRLPLKGNALEEPDADVKRIRAALLLAQSAPGMAAAMRGRPEAEFRIHDRFGYAWLNERTKAQFLEQMQQMGKLERLGEDPALMRGAVMVEEGDAPIYWIVLADGRAVRWKKFTSAPASAGAIRCQSVPMSDDLDELMKTRKDDLCMGEIHPGKGN